MNIFKQLIVSLYSPKAIASWRNQGIGKTILFVFFLTFISILPTTIHMSNMMTDGVEIIQETIEEELPPFTIENGQLISEEKAPITIYKRDFTLIFDATGELSASSLDHSIDSIAFLKNEVVMTSGGNMEQFSYALLNDLTLTKEDAMEFLSTLDSVFAIIIPIFFIIVYLFTSGMKFIGISLLALVGLLINTNNKDTISYRHIWRIAAYSVVLPTIFFTIMDVFQTTVPFGFLLNWVVSIIVLILALKEVPQEKNQAF